ncbi:hypothetical protein L0668_07595 [Paraglaciecola aquimarina]|uniref:Solute-binding protein family 3/N-terminal domain-containing protein n=1 Tax=Paraglaciecola algarum TaxID=3050085 RepID=A0ABS9D5B8_9ALTE|nr:hypothetical protein [Paraglaciecola sp. G1-23]MCF2947965.1 hypothetical protein [Paraglaciecola sp. G1-23]
MQSTKSEYGDFSITTEESGYTIARQIKIAQESPDIFMWASPYNPINQHLSIIEYPIFNGVLGLRSLVIHKNNLKNINLVTSIADLRRFTIGQGPGWMDVSIYKDNGFEVVEARLNKLFNMLSNERFELLPLGKLEIDLQTLSRKQGGHNLTIAPNHMIFYPHPVLFHLNQKHKKVIDRLSQGMQKITQNGELAALFEKHFSHETALINQAGMTVITMQNNTLPKKYLERMKSLPLLNRFSMTKK